MSNTPSANDLGSVVTNPRARAAIYTTYIILLVIGGAFMAAFLALGTGIPVWLMVATAVLAYLGLPVAGLARANTPDGRHEAK